jgi:hypothetical protein
VFGIIRRSGEAIIRLPLYLGFFESVYNLKRRGKRLLSSRLDVLLKKAPKPR